MSALEGFAQCRHCGSLRSHGSPLLAVGQQFDDITRRMDAAYAQRREAALRFGEGSAQYVSADDAIEAVYADLRVLNREMKA